MELDPALVQFVCKSRLRSQFQNRSSFLSLSDKDLLGFYFFFPSFRTNEHVLLRSSVAKKDGQYSQILIACLITLLGGNAALLARELRSGLCPILNVAYISHPPKQIKHVYDPIG